MEKLRCGDNLTEKFLCSFLPPSFGEGKLKRLGKVWNATLSTVLSAALVATANPYALAKAQYAAFDADVNQPVHFMAPVETTNGEKTTLHLLHESGSVKSYVEDSTLLDERIRSIDGGLVRLRRVVEAAKNSPVVHYTKSNYGGKVSRSIDIKVPDTPVSERARYRAVQLPSDADIPVSIQKAIEQNAQAGLHEYVDAWVKGGTTKTSYLVRCSLSTQQKHTWVVDANYSIVPQSDAVRNGEVVFESQLPRHLVGFIGRLSAQYKQQSRISQEELEGIVVLYNRAQLLRKEKGAAFAVAEGEEGREQVCSFGQLSRMLRGELREKKSFPGTEDELGWNDPIEFDSLSQAVDFYSAKN